MRAKPHLKVIAGRPVVVQADPDRESPLAAARRRAGGVFGWERKDFKWTQGATVLPIWLMRRMQEKK